MHGLVLLDRKKHGVTCDYLGGSTERRPIIRNRGTRRLDLLGQQCGIAPDRGFLIASLYWMKKCEAQLLSGSRGFFCQKTSFVSS